jgi:hypothetical protein
LLAEEPHNGFLAKEVLIEGQPARVYVASLPVTLSAGCVGAAAVVCGMCHPFKVALKKRQGAD